MRQRIMPVLLRIALFTTITANPVDGFLMLTVTGQSCSWPAAWGNSAHRCSGRI
jgi:hypothetical protein